MPRKAISFIDRHTQRKLIDELLTGKTETPRNYKSMEFRGIGGIGKTRVLDYAKARCRELNLPFVTIDFASIDHHASASFQLQALAQICDQLDHYFPSDSARAILYQRLNHNAGKGNGGLVPKENELIAFCQALLEHLKNCTLILMIDSAEYCKDDLFNWLGKDFVQTFLKSNQDARLLLFIAGRGPRVSASNWPSWMKRQNDEIYLDPFDLTITNDHVAAIAPSGKFTPAVQKIFDLSVGHPYSIETLVEALEQSGPSAGPSSNEDIRLAKILYDEVINRYILCDADTWVIPLIEVISITRRFDAGFLKIIFSKHYVREINDEPIQWFITHLAELDKQPLHLITVGPGDPAYSLDTTLRKLMSVCLSILKPDETLSIHRISRETFEQMLAGGFTSDGAAASTILEIIYHAARIAQLEHKELNEPVLAAVKTCLDSRFSMLQAEHNFESLIILKDLLRSDKDLPEILGEALLNQCIKQIDAVLHKKSQAYEMSFLDIQFTEPMDYACRWYTVDQQLLAQEVVNTSLKYTLEEIRQNPQLFGTHAFSSYLPARAQDFVRNRPDLAIQIITNCMDIPWELLHDDEEFLCLSRPIARKPAQLNESKIHYRNPESQPTALVVGDTLDDLPAAKEEALTVANLLEENGFQVIRLIGKEQATAKVFGQHIVKDRPDLIHIAGHAVSHPTDVKQSGVEFNDGMFLTQEFGRTLKSSPFIFLNACYAGKTDTGKSPLGNQGTLMEGIAFSALRGGAFACLGPIWDVEDDHARDFALAFYNSFLTGDPIGESVRLARLDIKKTSTDDWASWVLFGSPLQSLKHLIK